MVLGRIWCVFLFPSLFHSLSFSLCLTHLSLILCWFSSLFWMDLPIISLNSTLAVAVHFVLICCHPLKASSINRCVLAICGECGHDIKWCVIPHKKISLGITDSNIRMVFWSQCVVYVCGQKNFGIRHWQCMLLQKWGGSPISVNFSNKINSFRWKSSFVFSIFHFGHWENLGRRGRWAKFSHQIYSKPSSQQTSKIIFICLSHSWMRHKEDVK